ncbi:MAG: gamma-glutamyl-gamma-aminobutyrate hydrolase family protein [Pygmaiobacter massiliensis]|nr:gamma-glutamyl-gamma-aminobutyrate hydrolase family protein [Pygmaiobacter massiliensis]
MKKRVLVITNEWPGDPGLVPANTLRGITQDFYYVKNLVDQVRQITQGEVKEVYAQQLDLEMVKQYAPDYIVAGGHCNQKGWGDMDYLRSEYAVECELVRTTTVPYLGICAGHQFVSMAYGQTIAQMGEDYAKPEEVGPAKVQILENDPLFEGMPDPFAVMMYHSWEIKGIHPDFRVIGKTDLCRYAAVRHKDRPIYGVQFHPEMLGCPDVQDGKKLLENFFSL